MQRVWLIIILLAGLQLSGVGQVSQRVVSVTNSTAVNPNEISVAINPANPDDIVITGMQFVFPDGSREITNYHWISNDGGQSWNQVPNPNPQRRTQGDDAVTFSSDGTAYHSYISFDGIRQERPDPARNGIFVTKSTDGGRSWSSQRTVVDHLNTVLPFEDKPWLVTDNSSPEQSQHSGNLYLTWTRFDEYKSTHPSDSTQIYFSRSTDGAKTFSMPVRISDHGGNTLDNSNTVEGAVPSVGPNGEIYVAWSGPLGIVFDKSLDGGLTFGNDIHVADDPGGWDMEIEGISRANGMPVTGVDVSDGPYRGNIYINWVDKRNGAADVFCVYSADGGQNWSEPMRVNDDETGNGADQFFTWMAVDPINGTIYIAFYDRRYGNGLETGLTLARSTDGGGTFTNYRIDQPLFETTDETFFGDYLGIDAYNGSIVVAFQHFRGKKLAVSASIFSFE